ncbi:MAG: metallophosphoesterase, partial [Bacteroidota bacterium]
MRSRFLLVLKLLVGFLLFLLLTAAFLARCTNFDIRAEGKILFGYDEKKHRFQFGESPVYYLDGIDGPYLIGDTLYLVQENSTISKKVFRDSIVQVPIKSAPSKGFQVPLRAAYPRSAATYSLPTQLIAISDIEGNFKAFSSFLQVHGVINDRYEWTYGKGHLVLNGDFVDRGEQVLPVLWLIYKLEEEAMAQGGKVHFIMGNHELMNIRGDFRYAKGKYRKIAQEIRPSEERKESYRVLFSESSELGRWLRSKNAMTKIGDYLFVHAGLSPKLLNTELDINDINRIINKNLENRVLEDTLVRLLIGPESPLWYR